MNLVTVLKVEVGSLAALVFGLNAARESVVFTAAILLIYLGWRVRATQAMLREAFRVHMQPKLRYEALRNERERRAASHVAPASQQESLSMPEASYDHHAPHAQTLG